MTETTNPDAHPDLESRTAAEGAALRALIAEIMARSPRLAYNKTEAAEALGVSVEFFDEHVAPEVRSIRRGRRRIYSIGDLIYWLWRSAEGPDYTDPPAASSPA